MINQTNRSGAAGSPLAGSAGVLLVALGIFFLVARFLDVEMWSFAWPFMIIIPGLLFFGAMLAGGPSAGVLAIPGSIITTIGLILLNQNTFNHFESWAYAWALIPTAVGIGIVIDGRWSGEPSRVQRGSRLITVGLTLFAAGFVFFEFLLNLSGVFNTALGGWLLPLLLIGCGIYMFLHNPREPITGVKADVELAALEQDPPSQ